MQPRGVIISDTPLNANWVFPNVSVGSNSNFSVAIQNTGNAPGRATLNGTFPTVFTLATSPTTITANASSPIVGVFTPTLAATLYSGTGNLLISAPTAFCEPLPTQWNNPAITLSGTSN
jgi:hypothetical protein